VEPREHEATLELMGQRAEVVSGTQRLNVKLGDQHTGANLET